MLQNQLEGERSKGKLETEMCDADLWAPIEVNTEIETSPSRLISGDMLRTTAELYMGGT